MHLYSVLLYDTNYSLIYKNFNLSEFYFFVRSRIENAIIEIANVVIKNSNQEKFYQITEKLEDKTFHIYIYFHKDRHYIALTDDKYPANVIMEFLKELTDNEYNEYNEYTKYQELWQKYQDPVSVSKILQVKIQLEATKVTMLDSIDKVLERGDKIEDLIKKTDELEDISIKFKANATKLNSCCIML